MKDWSNYFKKHSNRKPKEQLIRALSFCKNKEVALDLGAGTLIETRAILDDGFKKVVAIDDAPDAEIFVKNFNDKRLDFKNISFQEYDFTINSFDFVNAEFALPFYGKETFDEFFKKIVFSLKPQGVFSGQLFGVNDSWNTSDSEIVFHTKDEVERLLSSVDVLEFKEEEKDAPSVSGVLKHWHIFHFIFRKT